MEPVLLSLHVLAAIVFVGGSAVASSLFPRYAPTRQIPLTPPPTTNAETAHTMRAATDAESALAMHAAAVAEAALAPHPVAAAETTGELNASSATGTDLADNTDRNPAVAAVLHRITGGYAAFGLIVPVVGIVLAAVQGRMGEVWITISMVLTAAAGLLLATQIHPRQRQALDTPGDVRRLRTLSMLAGIYNLLWAVVAVLMIVRPGGQAGF